MNTRQIMYGGILVLLVLIAFSHQKRTAAKKADNSDTGEFAGKPKKSSSVNFSICKAKPFLDWVVKGPLQGTFNRAREDSAAQELKTLLARKGHSDLAVRGIKSTTIQTKYGLMSVYSVGGDVAIISFPYAFRADGFDPPRQEMYIPLLKEVQYRIANDSRDEFLPWALRVFEYCLLNVHDREESAKMVFQSYIGHVMWSPNYRNGDKLFTVTLYCRALDDLLE